MTEAKKIDTGGAAFPSIYDQSFEQNFGHEAGMTLRDYFAAKAMQGMLSHATRYKPREVDNDIYWHAALVKEAYEIADAMIAARGGSQ